MISSQTEYQKAREELEHLTRWLERLQSEKTAGEKTLTIASVRRMIARIQEELAEYEADTMIPPASEQRTTQNDGGADRDAQQ